GTEVRPVGVAARFEARRHRGIGHQPAALSVRLTLASGPMPDMLPPSQHEVYQRLLKERIIFLGTQVDDQSANLICAQLLLLAAEEPEKDIALYINSPGGSVTAGLAIYDTMQLSPSDVSTVCMGPAASMGQVLL